jgi:hypothetical protein
MARQAETWIASSLTLLAMTAENIRPDCAARSKGEICRLNANGRLFAGRSRNPFLPARFTPQR